ncbi:thioredoxin domain-containing protein [Pseudomonas sp. M30-35]|uniref:DsbA family protein n=1 Tax=Pseudomonas sp. M30-35 TaxID=1981174 RepID=UPI000B3BE349|nr:thioredoxin domain-containing protein [Pseudomonas sp. M30-35]ARU88790.1 disulfide bond formation protein DsbA [Pseudomonas sp. M30-35]
MSRRVTVLVVASVLVIAFAAAAIWFKSAQAPEQTYAPQTASSSLVRFHSPVIGAANAPVTIVEFFDPSCEACRAFFPLVKKLIADNPDDVRLVLRYVLFHEASETAARILETARKQGVYSQVLEAVMASQPQWHDDPQAKMAWVAAKGAGLDIDKAKAEMMSADITSTLEKDSADAKAVGIRQTPTFFVNGKSLPSFGSQQLINLVEEEVAQTK